jgi:hypothetical protein
MDTLPAEAPTELLAQLRVAIPDDPEGVTACVRQIATDAWRGVLLGDATAPARWLAELDALPPVLSRHPEVRALRDALRVGDLAVEDGSPDADDEALGRRYPELLAALQGSRGRLLTQAEVVETIGKDRWGRTDRAAGHVLAKLFERGLLVRVYRKAQGAASAAHYGLSGRGLQLCRTLAIGAEAADAPLRLFELPAGRWAPLLDEGRPRTLPLPPARIFAFHQADRVCDVPSAMIGVARHVAAQWTHVDRSVLTLDLALEAPELDALVPGGGRVGFEALVERTRGMPASGREEAIDRALTTLAFNPDPQRPRWFHLSAGTPDTALGPLLAALRREMAAQPVDADGRPHVATSGWLGALRTVLARRFDLVLIHAAPGVGELTWLATILLGDRLVCFHPGAEERCQRARRVVGHVMAREGRGVADGVSPVVRVAAGPGGLGWAWGPSVEPLRWSPENTVPLASCVLNVAGEDWLGRPVQDDPLLDTLADAAGPAVPPLMRMRQVLVAAQARKRGQTQEILDRMERWESLAVSRTTSPPFERFRRVYAGESEEAS